MPDQHEGQSGVLTAGDTGESAEVVDHMLEVSDQGPPTVETTMAHVVIGVHDGPTPGQHLGHVIVSASVFGIAMNDEDDPGRRDFGIPPPVEEDTAL